MRVLHLASGDGWGGAERSLLLLLEGARSRPDLECAVVLLNEGVLSRRLRAAGVPVWIVDENECNLATLARRVRGLARDQGFDIVHAHRYKEFILGAVALAPRSRRLVATIHGLAPLGQLTLRQAAGVWGSLAVVAVAGAQLIAVSHELTGRIRRALPMANVRRIPNPMVPVGSLADVDLRRDCGWPATLPVVGFVGRLERVKGPDRLLEAAARISGDAGVVFVGDGSLRPDLEEQARGLDRPGRVRFLGEVDDAAPYLAQVDVLALPSRHEGVPMVLLEAAALRKPVVAFDVGGVGEVLGGGEPATRLVPDGDVSAFAAALARALGGVDRRDVDRWAAHVDREFSQAAVLDAYLSVYRNAGRR